MMVIYRWRSVTLEQFGDASRCRENPLVSIFLVSRLSTRYAGRFCTSGRRGYSTVLCALLETSAEPRRHSFAAVWPRPVEATFVFFCCGARIGRGSARHALIQAKKQRPSRAHGVGRRHDAVSARRRRGVQNSTTARNRHRANDPKTRFFLGRGHDGRFSASRGVAVAER